MNDKEYIPAESADCCDVWPKIAPRFDWIGLIEHPHLLVLPHVKVGDEELFVGYCPACGRRVKGIIMAKSRVDGEP